MKKELQNVQIARFALSKTYSDIAPEIIDKLKRHLLDSTGSLIHSTKKATPLKLVRQMKSLSEGGPCKVPLLDRLPYDRAAQLYTALIRYPDFMDNYMGKEATCHPSDNIGPILAMAQYAKANGKDLLTAIAIAYEIECRLVEEIPVMKEGIDHTLLLAYSMTAGIAKFAGLDEQQTAHALAMSGCSISPMVTSRASYTYEWKGLASSLDALNCTGIAFMAMQGLTGPIALFEEPKGFQDVFDMKLDYDWSKETFERIPKCVLKRFNAEVHSQSVLEGIVELKQRHDIDATHVKKIEITTFLTAYHIIGSGAYGDRKNVGSKEQADHSMFYLAAVALLDGEVYPEQFHPERIMKQDVQQLLQKVSVQTKSPLHKPVVLAGVLDPYTEAYPDKMMGKVTITMNNGDVYTCEKEDYYGFFTRPMSWDDVIAKFKRITSEAIDADHQQQIIDIIRDIEHRSAEELTNALCDHLIL